MNQGELVPYTTAEQMAATFVQAVAKYREAAALMAEQGQLLNSAFLMADKYDRYKFTIDLRYGHESTSSSIEEIIAKMKLAAWGAIIEKLNIRRLMSSKRIAQLDAALGRGSNRGWNRHGDEQPPDFPEITPENIVAVAQGYVMSATEFLEEAIAEEYEHWRPRMDSKYKTNANGFWKLTKKLIKGYTVEPGYGGNGKFRCNYHNQSHVTALDNIFHMLDGQGPVKEYKGALASAIETAEDGRGETAYFKFKAYGNGNLHLEFKRQDLLDLFNSIAGKSDRLGQQRRAG